jgi:hypothetical protein
MKIQMSTGGVDVIAFLKKEHVDEEEAQNEDSFKPEEFEPIEYEGNQKTYGFPIHLGKIPTTIMCLIIASTTDIWRDLCGIDFVEFDWSRLGYVFGSLSDLYGVKFQPKSKSIDGAEAAQSTQLDGEAEKQPATEEKEPGRQKIDYSNHETLQDKANRDLLTLRRLNSGSPLAHTRLLSTLCELMDWSTPETAKMHDEFNEWSQGFIGKFKTKQEAIDVVSYFSNPEKKKNKIPISLDFTEFDQAFLVHAKHSRWVCPSFDHFCGSPFSMGIPSELFRNELTTENENKSKNAGRASVMAPLVTEINFDFKAFKDMFRENKMEAILRHNTEEYREYVRIGKPWKEYAYAGSNNNKHVNVVFQKLKVGQQVSAPELYAHIMSLDTRDESFAVWFHRMRSHFSMGLEGFTFTNAGLVKKPKTA